MNHSRFSRPSSVVGGGISPKKPSIPPIHRNGRPLNSASTLITTTSSSTGRRSRRKGIPSKAPSPSPSSSSEATTSSSTSSSRSSHIGSTSSSSFGSTSSSSSVSAASNHKVVNVSALLRALLRESERSGYQLDLPRFVAPSSPANSAKPPTTTTTVKKERDVLVASDPNYGRGKRAVSQALREDHLYEPIVVSIAGPSHHHSRPKLREASPGRPNAASLRRNGSTEPTTTTTIRGRGRSTEPAASSSSSSVTTSSTATSSKSRTMTRASSLGPIHHHSSTHHHHHPYARTTPGNDSFIVTPTHPSPLARSWVTNNDSSSTSSSSLSTGSTTVHVRSISAGAGPLTATTTTIPHGRERGVPRALQDYDMHYIPA